MMKTRAEFFARKHHRLGLWIAFYETRLTGRIIGEFIKMVNEMMPRVTKLAIVGSSSQ